MEIEDILSLYAGKDTRLNDDAYARLYGSGYVFTPDTPPAIKREIQLVYASLSKNPESVDLHDPYVVEAFSKMGLKQIDDLYNAFGVLRGNNIPYDHLPNAELYTSCVSGISPKEFEPTSAFTLRMFDRLTEGPLYEPWVEKDIPVEEATLSMLIDLETRYGMCKENGKNTIIDAILDTELPPTMIPTKIIQDPLFIDRYCSHIGIEGENKKALIEILSTQTCSEELEHKLSAILGHATLDETLSTEILNNPMLADPRDQYGPRDKSKDIVLLAAIKLNAVKYLHSKGIYDVPVDLNVPRARSSKTPAANYNHEEKKIRLFTTPNVGLQEHTKASIHEGEHAIQDFNLRNNNIKEDPDIDFYAMDKVIRIISDRTTDKDYYVDNTFTISDEYDADYKAAITTYNLKNIGKPKDSLLNELKDEIRTRKEKSQTILDEISTTVLYKLERSRIYNGKRMDIEDAFRVAVESTMSKKPTLWQEIRSRIDTDFPILKFKYSFEDGRVHRFTPEELVGKLGETVEEKDKEVYMGLIRNSITPRKDLNAEKNTEEYSRLIEDPKVPIDIRRDLRTTLTTPQKNKYETLLNDIKHERK